MGRTYDAMTNGTYIFRETDEENQFLFYRNDHQELGDVGRTPLDMYQKLIAQKMFSGEITEIVRKNVYTHKLDDGKRILVIAYTPGTEPEYLKSRKNKEPKSVEKKPNIWQRIAQKIFG